ncbi:hypothetical protein DRQ53_08585 [bacterium]|nr:MAG: hypothetical protein DRQ53_08585 [bacterium]
MSSTLPLHSIMYVYGLTSVSLTKATVAAVNKVATKHATLPWQLKVYGVAYDAKLQHNIPTLLNIFFGDVAAFARYN